MKIEIRPKQMLKKEWARNARKYTYLDNIFIKKNNLLYL